MSNALLFIVVLSVLVLVHEFGHFLVAKLIGIRVEKFSIGFGPVLFGRRIAGTEFQFSLLPLGGFVKMAGENPGEAEGKEWEFNSKPPGQRFLVVTAGPLMNAALAFALFVCVFLFGRPTLTTEIGRVMEKTPAQAAGILEGDRILSVNGREVTHWEDVLAEVHRGGERVVFELERRGEVLNLEIRPKTQEVSSLFGGKRKIPFVGVQPSPKMVYVKAGFFQSLTLAAVHVVNLTLLIFYSLGLMLSGVLPFKESVTGPIGIYFMTQHYAQMGILPLLYFMGSLSVSLFVLNLLPIPVLDGGHVLFLFIERLKGSPLKESVKERMTQGGLAILVTLMAIVILQDIHRFSALKNLFGR